MATRDPFCRRKAAARKIAVRVGDHERGVRGSDDPSDVLADRSRLQKSTGGVRPVATEGEEPLEPTSGLAAPGESQGKRKRAGSRVFGGKAEIPVAGSHQNRHAKARPFGSTCRWKAFWVEQAAPFDEGAGEAILGASSGAWSSDRAERGVRQRASEVVHQLRTWPITPRRGGTALTSGSPRLELSRNVELTSRVVGWTEAGERAVKRAPPGAGSPKGGLAPRLPTSFGSGGGRGRRGASHALGNHAIHGCSCRESVAEVGEEHLSRTLEGSREANREGAR
jgi:hypothetical protein